MTNRRKLLILSNGPVPAPEQHTVEGGGLRCWGLAKGIVANKPEDIEVTVAYEASYAKDDMTESFEDILITTWTIEAVGEIIQSYDTILVSYCMGELSVVVAEAIRPDQQLVLDCNVPIYVEASARETTRLEEEYRDFSADVTRWGSVLRRGDLFLCANQQQKDFYKGVLAALGRINPVTYASDLIRIVPYGIYRDKPVQTTHPIEALIGDKEKYHKILWFGGIYPWFDIRDLANAIKEVNATYPAKLVVVGAKNPFNKHPDFLARYDEFIKHIEENDLSQYVVLQEWVDFNDRASWYLDADIVVVFNRIGEENRLSWRTRLVDFMWADLPVLTNGGDPLGEKMIEHDAAVRVKSVDASGIASSIVRTIENKPDGINSLKKNMALLKKEYYWDVVTQEAATDIMKGERASDYRYIDGEQWVAAENPNSATGRSLSGMLRKAKKIPAYAKKHGYVSTLLAIKELVRRKLTAVGAKKPRREPAYVIVSHQLDNSGAPFIAVDVALELKEAKKKVEFYTYMPTKRDVIARLRKAGITPHVLLKKEMVPTFIAGDTVILNTVAHSETTKETLLHAAEKGEIKLLWYLHEDFPATLFRNDEKRRINNMLQSDQAVLFIAAQRMKNNYDEFFGASKNIRILPYRHIVPKQYHQQRKANDFSKKLTFVLPGTVGDGRKGQLPIFYAFVDFYEKYYKINPDKYRDFELTFIGLDKDFLSRQLIAHADALKGHFSHYGKLSWHDDLEVVSKGNMTICYSLAECLPLFVFEGMIAGHPILRNDSSGMEEQLVEGKNGYLLHTNDYPSLVHVIETVLNKKKTSDESLANMSRESYKIAKRQENNSYLKGMSIE